MIHFLLIFSDWALVALRIILGLVLLTYGWSRIKKTKKDKVISQKINFRDNHLVEIGKAFLNCGAGMFILFGFLTQIMALLIFIEFLINLITTFITTKSLNINKEKNQLKLLILASASILITMGGGLFSINSILKILIY